jgi:hypothetical protein
MRVPQVSERIKEAPAQALRGVFAGIGQLLLITDKLRNKTPAYAPPPRTPQESQTVADTTTAEPAAPVAPAPAPAPEAAVPEAPVSEAPAPEPRDFDKTGNVRLVSEPEAPAEAGKPGAPEESGEPLPNYGELSLASLRARLRNLDVAQLRQVAEYERAHEARADVIAMFERRIAKLEAEPEAGA